MGEKIKIEVELDEAIVEWIKVIAKEMGMSASDAVAFILWRWYEIWRLGYDAAKYPQFYGIED